MWRHIGFAGTGRDIVFLTERSHLPAFPNLAALAIVRAASTGTLYSTQPGARRISQSSKLLFWTSTSIAPGIGKNVYSFDLSDYDFTTAAINVVPTSIAAVDIDLTACRVDIDLTTFQYQPIVGRATRIFEDLYDAFYAPSLATATVDLPAWFGIGDSSATTVQVERPQELPEHAMTARKLRELTGLSANELAEMLGVRRESFQRWLAGGPIKALNEGHLRYLDGLMAETHRRLGMEQFRAWLRTPIDVRSGRADTPLSLLARGYFDDVHSLIVALPDHEPIVNGRVVSLQKMLDDETS